MKKILLVTEKRSESFVRVLLSGVVCGVGEGGQGLRDRGRGR